MYTLSETFDDPRGRWDQLAPWDGTENSDSAKGFLSTQTHVDVRSFRNIADLLPLPQTKIDTPVAQSALDTESQTNMESYLGANQMNENWISNTNFLNTLTMSSNEITDAVRVAGVEGDGAPVPGGVGVWEATENLALYSGGPSAWTDFNGGSLTQDATHVLFSGARDDHMKLTTPGVTVAGGGEGMSCADANRSTAVNEQTYTGSIWVYSVAGGESVAVDLDQFNGATYLSSVGIKTYVLVAGWQRLVCTATTDQPTITSIGMTFRTFDVPEAITVWLVGMQVEQKPFATPLVRTSGALVSRPAARVQAPATLMNPTQGWFAVRLRMGFASTDDPGAGSAVRFAYLGKGTGDTDGRLLLAWSPAGAGFSIFRSSPGNTSGGHPFKSLTFARGDYITVVGYYTATTLAISVNGSTFVTAANTTIPNTPTIFDIGTEAGTLWADSSILWFACGTGTLTDANAATMNGFGNTPPAFTSVPGTPSAVWSAVNASFSEDPGLTNLAVGPIAARGGWPGLQMQTNGHPVDCILTSSIPGDHVDISWCADLSLILPDYSSFDSTSTVQLTSDPNGVFGNGFDSAAVAFSANASVMPQLLLPVANFAHTGFDNTKVTGVKVELKNATAPTTGQTVTLMALRGMSPGWVESWLDFDTRLGAIYRPVTLTGNAYVGTVAQSFEFVRGDGTKNDPIPADTAMNMYFYPGGSTSPNDATGATFNYVAFLLRETKDSPDGLGSHLEVGLSFNDSSTSLKAMMRNTSGGSPATTTTDTGSYTISVGGALDPLKHYLFRVQVRGTQIYATLYETLIDHTIVSLVWQIPITLTNSAYTYRNGRVGFIASLISRDAYVEALDVAPTGFAELVTQVYPSRTPIDGAQLAAVCASDINLFSSVTGSDVIIDQTKTISGSGSYRTALGVTTNAFIVDDWTQTYLDVAIWVPSGVTLLNQPVIVLNTDASTENIAIDKLQPAQWNTVHVDLGVFRNLITGSGYSLSISAASTPDKPLGYFWIDDITIGRRRVAWSVRATQNGQYREFKDTLNNPFGAVHFTPDERGSYLQLKAVALTDDAWVSSFKLFPRYANLGLPVYDQGFET